MFMIFLNFIVNLYLYRYLFEKSKRILFIIWVIESVRFSFCIAYKIFIFKFSSAFSTQLWFHSYIHVTYIHGSLKETAVFYAIIRDELVIRRSSQPRSLSIVIQNLYFKTYF